MNNFKETLPAQDSAVGRALKTFVQAIIGLLIGLVVTIWAVPGVPTAVTNYLQNNLLQVLLTVGVPSGFASLVWNLLRKDVKNY